MKRKTIKGLESQISQLQMIYGIADSGWQKERAKNATLINKNEAMQSIMDSMAHLATAGQALIEL